MLINPEYSLEGLMLKLKLQYFGHQMQRPNSLKKTPMLGKMKAGEEDNRGWDGWMASPTQWTWVWANSRRWWRTGKPGMLHSMRSQRVGHNWAAEQQQQSGHWDLTDVENLLQPTITKIYSSQEYMNILYRINYMWGYKTSLHKY